MKHSAYCLILSLLSIFFFGQLSGQETFQLTGKIVDEKGRPLAARLYIESLDDRGRFYHAKPLGEGSAAPYEKKRGVRSVEIHTCLSANPFHASLPAGRYRLTAKRGHESIPATIEVEVGPGEMKPVELVVKRWIDMAELGWFSGDTHCHRTIEELRTVLPAEDLNVGLPLTAWVTDSTQSPAEDNRNKDKVPGPELIRLGGRHVIWPVNTEYEIFSVAKNRHVLGAVFVLNHRTPLTLKVPPVRPVAKAARDQGAILDLDKHNWPWSMSIVPVMDVNLFELTNNHVWRTEFAFTNWYTNYVPDYMKIPLRRLDNREGEAPHIDEAGWLDFGFQTYYALLNCGLRMMPSGGTASGVHPVPLGFGRVYARTGKSENGEVPYAAWIEALRDGKTFVTTGPMLFFEAAGHGPGSELDWEANREIPFEIRIESQFSVTKVELIRNGEVITLGTGEPDDDARAPHSRIIKSTTVAERSMWLAARVFCETPGGRLRFAHSAPIWFGVEGSSLTPKVEEADYLRKRVEVEMERHRGVLTSEALEEMQEAAAFFRERGAKVSR